MIEETTTTITVEWSKVAADGLQGYQLTYCKIPDEEDPADVGGVRLFSFCMSTLSLFTTFGLSKQWPVIWGTLEKS